MFRLVLPVALCLSLMALTVLQQNQQSVRGVERYNVDEIPNHQRRVVVVSVWFRYPELLKAHTASVRAFLPHEAHPIVEVVVVNNARDPRDQENIRKAAIDLNVHHIQVPDALTNMEGPSFSHANALDSALGALLEESELSPPFPQQYDMLLIVDSDMFFMDKVSLVTELKGAAIASPIQRREAAPPYPGSSYLWPNLILFSFGEWYVNRSKRHGLTELWNGEPAYKSLYRELKFRNCGPRPCFNCDSGGCTKKFMMDHPDLMVTEWGFEHEMQTCANKHDSLISGACRYWRQEIDTERPSGCALPTLSGPVYHMGSAGSNWRGCKGEWLDDQREKAISYIQRIVPGDIADSHFRENVGPDERVPKL